MRMTVLVDSENFISVDLRRGTGTFRCAEESSVAGDFIHTARRSSNRRKYDAVCSMQRHKQKYGSLDGSGQQTLDEV